MRLSKNSFGFTVVETFLVVAIMAIIGFAGYKVYDTKNSTDKINGDTTAGSQQLSGIDTSGAPAINSASDLDKALNVLGQYDPQTDNSSDLSQLDSQVSTF